MRYLILVVTVLTIFYSYCLIYRKGLSDGEWNYKRSHRMYMALKSSYHFGYLDAKRNLPEDYDNGGE